MHAFHLAMASVDALAWAKEIVVKAQRIVTLFQALHNVHRAPACYFWGPRANIKKGLPPTTPVSDVRLDVRRVRSAAG